MKRLIVLTALAAFVVALPVAHGVAAEREKVPGNYCLTGKNTKVGRLVRLPDRLLDRFQERGIGSACFTFKSDGSCVIRTCK